VITTQDGPQDSPRKPAAGPAGLVWVACLAVDRGRIVFGAVAGVPVRGWDGRVTCRPAG